MGHFEHYCFIACLTLLNGIATIAISADEYFVTVTTDPSASKTIVPFWKSTGFCPPDPHNKASKFMLSDDMKLNLAFIGGLPHDAVRQIRTHWLLELVSFDSQNLTDINFANLDAYLDSLKKNGLTPGFEIMGNPSGAFHDFEVSSEVRLLYDVIKRTAQHCVDRYGEDYVEEWNWESWNEPDNDNFDNLTMTARGLMNYYDACSEALMSVNKNFKLGAPAQKLVEGRSPKAWALLQHCFDGTNFFTGENGTRLDYISVHYKGGGYSLPILKGEMDIAAEIYKRWNNFSSLRFYNDEADPMVRWSDPYPWRADNTYAAIIVKVIAQHWFEKLTNSESRFSSSYALLGNDNAFLSYHPSIFEQRTILARFQINDTSPPYVMLIRKPAYVVLGLLSYLDDEALHVTIRDKTGDVFVNTSDVGVLATAFRQNTSIARLTLLVYNSNDTSNKSVSARVNILLDRFIAHREHADLSYRYMIFSMDNKISNPYSVWKNLSSPYFPTFRQLERILRKEEPRYRGPFNLTVSNPINFNTKIRMPGIKLIHVCSKTRSVPGTVSGVSFYNITSNLILVTWDDSSVKTKCVKTYEIEKLNRNGKYKRVNLKDTVFNTFVYNPLGRKKPLFRNYAGNASQEFYELDKLVKGFYRIRAVDYWSRSGPYSSPVRYPSV